MDSRANQLIHVPILDQMRFELQSRGFFEQDVDSGGFRELMNSSLNAYLRNEAPDARVTNGLNVELDGAQAYVSGWVDIQKNVALVAVGQLQIFVDDFSLMQDPNQKGRIKFIDQPKIRVEGNDLASKFANISKLRQGVVNYLSDPNRAIFDGVKSQLPQGMEVKTFGLYLDRGRLGIKIGV